jgi:endonuclease YncB( thermonuclease family)
MLVFAVGVSPLLADEAIVKRADRDVSPPGVMPVPAGPLVREPVPPTPPEPARWRRYFLPATTDAGTFQVQGLTIHVSGVTPPARSDVCEATDGGSWPCGASALFALRRFLHGRAVECYFPQVEGVNEVTAPCRVGHQDIGLWLLQHGWATPSAIATDDYRAGATTAACAGLGLHRGGTAPSDCALPKN